MPTLSQVTLETRAILKWGAIILGILIAIFFIFKIKAIFSPPPPPTVGFGKLPAIEFPQNQVTKKLTYSLDTLSGTFPIFPTSKKVFKIERSTPDLLSLNRASEKTGTVGFDGKPIQVSENLYQWKNKDKILTMSLLDYNFNFTSDYLLNSAIPNFNATTDDAIKTGKDFLSKMDLLPEDLDDSQTKTEIFSIKNYKLSDVSSLSGAQVVRVNFFQKSLGGLPIFYSSLDSPMNLTLDTPDQREPQVVEANFFYQKPSDTFSTYPVKTAEQAFKDLKNDLGYIVDAPKSLRISIKKVELGYYISDKRQSYLLPIIVFEGDSFKAYVPAITNEWVNR